ncbi:MAG: efflux RND transporter periplasmic adaptor subunit [Bacteroidetes bacterium]|nr:efflux RND transporter periplasmic adaptor subunit [Bacteroidota bacterium]
MNRTILPFFSALAVSLVLLAGCSESIDGQESSTEEAAIVAAPGQTRTVRVTAMAIEARSFEEIIPLTGTVSAPLDASLSAQAAGTLLSLLETGTRVQEGDVVAKLDDRLIRAALDQARGTLSSVESQARLAEETWRRQERQETRGRGVGLEYENVLTQRNQAQAALTQAKAAVAQAEQQSENTFVRAPFDGVVEERYVEKGEQLMPGMQVARIVNTRQLKVVAGVPETYSSDIRRGTVADLSFRAYAGGDRKETISFVGSVINPQNRTFQIEIEIDNPNGLLKPAMIVDIKLTRRVMTDQVVIPQTAILRDENGSSVYVAVQSNGGFIAERRAITLGPSYAGQTVVLDGISTGDRVITAGQTSVAEGDNVTVAN